MPSLKAHLRADKALGIMPQSHIHILLDQFAHYPDMRFLSQHRKFLHHREGIEYILLRYGEDAAKSATQHVIDDCGEVPGAVDYYDGTVDNFGYRSRE